MSELSQILKEVQETKVMLAKQDIVLARLDENHKTTRSIVDTHSEVLWDTPHGPGLATRLDRMETAQVSRSRLAAIGFSILTLIGVKPLYDLIRSALGIHN